MNGTISLRDHDLVLDMQNKKRDSLQRIYRITAAGLASHAAAPEQGWRNHDLYLPLVANEFATLEAIGPDGNTVSLSTTTPTTVAAFRWTNTKGKKTGVETTGGMPNRSACNQHGS